MPKTVSLSAMRSLGMTFAYTRARPHSCTSCIRLAFAYPRIRVSERTSDRLPERPPDRPKLQNYSIFHQKTPV